MTPILFEITATSPDPPACYTPALGDRIRTWNPGPGDWEVDLIAGDSFEARQVGADLLRALWFARTSADPWKTILAYTRSPGTDPRTIIRKVFREDYDGLHGVLIPMIL